MKGNGIFSHESDHWKTPTYIYNLFVNQLKCVDPCPYHSKNDNLKTDMGGVDLFINPPYSDIKSWVDYAIQHIEKHKMNTVYMLIPSRTDTKYFHKMINSNLDMGIYFFEGRLHFNESKGAAPFPSCLIKLTAPKSKIYFINKI
ncbi:MAG: adenine methyltransferase [Bacilli bacterium]|nr:adenine methyltransferase [Bacilli bacterium]